MKCKECGKPQQFTIHDYCHNCAEDIIREHEGLKEDLKLACEEWNIDIEDAHVLRTQLTKLMKKQPEMLAVKAIRYYYEVLKEARGINWYKNPDHVLQEMLNAVPVSIHKREE